jgi:hypothetical protein
MALPSLTTNHSHGSAIFDRVRSSARKPSTWANLLLFVALFFLFTKVPLGTVDEKHDPGSILSYEYFAERKFQFGTQVIQNIGPYGHLGFPQFYAGIRADQKLCFSAVYAALLSVLVLLGLRYFEGKWERIAWLLAIAFAPTLPQPGTAGEAFEFIAPLFLLLSCHYLLTRGWYKGHWLLDAAVYTMLALVALMKGTGIALVGLLVILALVDQLSKGHRARFGLDLCFFCAAFLLFWRLANQSQDNLGAFLTGSYAFIAGYNEAMAMDVAGEGVLVLLTSGAFATFFAAKFLALSPHGISLRRVLLFVFESACFFVTWKHAYVRADHGPFLRHFLVMALPVVILAHRHIKEPPDFSAEGWTRCLQPFRQALNRFPRLPEALCAIAMLLTLISCVRGGDAPDTPIARMTRSLDTLWNWKETKERFDKDLARVKAASQLPQVKREVWKATIDQFGFEPGWMVLNDLNYTPRPMSINFAAYNDPLIKLNAAFYRDPKTAPEYLLARLASTDDRLVAPDDSIAVLEALRRYEPVLIERGLLLLRRKQNQPPDYQLKHISTHLIKADEFLEVPHEPGKSVWCKVRASRTLGGQIRSFLYKPAPLYIGVDSDKGFLGSAKFLTCSGPTGFQVNPLVLNAQAFVNLFVPEGRKQHPNITRIKFTPKEGLAWQFKDAIEVSFWSVE